MNLLRRTAAALLGEEMEPPPSLPAGCLPPGVRLRRGRLVPWIGGRLIRSRQRAAAVTLGRTIVVDPAADLTEELLRHELAHVRQWREDALFPLRYTLATLRHGYRNNPYEVEARAAAESTSPP